MNSGRVVPPTGTTSVKFLGPTRTSSFQAQQQTIDARLSRLKLAADSALSDRLVVKSEPARPKPRWLGEDLAAGGSNNKDVDDDGFEDILQ